MAVRVVVAEDESIIRLDLVETLAEEGYEVVGETGRGDDAVGLCRRLGPDVAIFDVKMPGMDGLEAARAVVSERVCPVLVLTAFSQRDLVEQAGDAGVLGYLVKPFQRSELVPAIELALRRWRELVALEGEVASLSERLAVRKAIDRAKGVLIDRHGLAEADAFRFLQRAAMDHRTTMRAVAEAVVDGSLPGPA